MGKLPADSIYSVPWCRRDQHFFVLGFVIVPSSVHPGISGLACVCHFSVRSLRHSQTAMFFVVLLRSLLLQERCDDTNKQDDHDCDGHPDN